MRCRCKEEAIKESSVAIREILQASFQNEYAKRTNKLQFEWLWHKQIISSLAFTYV
jgi:hypothetical protein